MCLGLHFQIRARGIFGDILKRIPPTLLETLKSLRQSYVDRRDYQAAGKVARHTATARLGREFMHAAWKMMEEADAESFPHQAWCYQHGRLRPCNKRKRVGAFSVHIAGPTCVDWSMLGDRDGWLGKAVLAFLCWLHELVRDRDDAPDMVIVENVDQFDEGLLSDLAKPVFHMAVMNVDPSQFGWPCTRNRKYMVLLRHDVVAWAPPALRDPPTVFQQLFERPVSLDGRVFVSAPESYVASFHASWARRKNMPEKQLDGGMWPAKLLMSSGVRERVREWEEKL